MATKAQLRRLEAAFPGKYFQLQTTVDNFGKGEGKPARRIFQAYVAGTEGADVDKNFATGETYHKAVTNLIIANKRVAAA